MGEEVPNLCKFRQPGTSKSAQLAELGQNQAVLQDPSWGSRRDWGRPRPNWIRQAVVGDLVLGVAEGVIPVPLLALAIEVRQVAEGLVLTVGNVLAGVVGKGFGGVGMKAH
jgi:hypothetical protein